VIGRVETTRGPGGELKSSRLIIPSAPARLDITFLSAESADAFAPDVWRPRGR
jgi:hypothetical protein